MDERSAEVARVLRVLAAHAAEHARASAAEAQERPVDAYEVLGVELDAPAGGRCSSSSRRARARAGGWLRAAPAHRAAPGPASPLGPLPQPPLPALLVCVCAPTPLPETLFSHHLAAPACVCVCPAGEVRKRYWRLSLLIHPDKCDHPRAHDAFQAVTSAAKELQARALPVPGRRRGLAGRDLGPSRARSSP